MTDASHCRSCGAPVLWVLHERKTPGQSPTPLDAEPVSDGNCRVLEDGRYQVIADSTRREVLRGQGVPLHLSHFVTCPHSSAWRRRA